MDDLFLGLYFLMAVGMCKHCREICIFRVYWMGYKRNSYLCGFSAAGGKQNDYEQNVEHSDALVDADIFSSRPGY